MGWVGVGSRAAPLRQSLLDNLRVYPRKTASVNLSYVLYKISLQAFPWPPPLPFPLNRLPKDWRQEPPPPSLQRLGDNWVKSNASAILAVPSVIIPKELNYLINPNHPDFPKLKIEKPTRFAFDQRLFR